MSKRSNSIAIGLLVCTAAVAGAYQHFVPTTVGPVSPVSALRIETAKPVGEPVRSSAPPIQLDAPQPEQQVSIVEHVRAKLSEDGLTAQDEQVLETLQNDPSAQAAVQHYVDHLVDGKYVAPPKQQQAVERQLQAIAANARGEVRSSARDAKGNELPSNPYAALKAQGETE